MASMIAGPREFHISIRVADLGASTAFYEALFGVLPKEMTSRYTTFIVPHLALNFVLLVNDKGEALDTYSLYHLGIGVADRDAVVTSYHRAVAAGAAVVKPPRTTWRGTPLHELWLRDPTGYGIEIYARLTPQELATMPDDQAPTYLVAGTEPVVA
ncbi:MAG: VOC family protein [Acidiphilium sp.]|nr:VOC family protein [Acidiphilium sp.]MDD4936724.1 VOC family protein [Acidiphilium sp.]